MGTSISWGATCDGLAPHSEGNRNFLSHFMPRKLEINTGLMNQMLHTRLARRSRYLPQSSLHLLFASHMYFAKGSEDNRPRH